MFSRSNTETKGKCDERERERARPSERSTVHKHRHGVRDKSFFTRQIQLSGNESNRVLFKLYATAVRNVSAAFI